MIGHDPHAPGAFGELMLVSEVLSRTVPDGVPIDAVAVVDAFTVGVLCYAILASRPVSCRSSSAQAIGLSAVAALVARGVAPVIVSDYSADRLEYAKKFGADILVNPSTRSPVRGVARRRYGTNDIQTAAGDLRVRRAPGLLAEHHRIV